MITNKVAIITGASSGIGEATALTLAKAGVKVAIGARRVDRLEELSKKIIANGGEVYFQKLDVTKREECDNFAKAVLDKWGSIDILVNNAGLMPLSFFKNLKVDEWDRMIDVNYCATKFAVAAFTEGLRQEFSVRSNIRVTSIEPGVVDTELNNTITDESLQGFLENTKKMEALQAQDIANAILYAVNSPSHVNVNEILIRPTTQEK